MVKKIISVLSILIFFSYVRAQEGETFLGLHMSPTISWMKSDDNLINSNGIRLGFRIGGTAEYYLDDWLVVSGGFGFSFSQGGKLLHKVGGNLLPDSKIDAKFREGDKPLPDDTDIRYSLQMMEVPMALKYVIGLPNQNIDVFLSFPEINVALVGRSRGNIDATGIELTKQDIGGDVRPFNLSWGVGAGIRYFTAGDQLVSASLHLEQGLSDLTSNDGVQTTTLPAGSFSKKAEESKGTLNALVFKFALFF
ncbi:MAG: outer membrane beta-barrel protein [Saprospiraceae bacterium]|nr:outer membrane beta-barrel protein [Saprospiraceae bacterium]